MYDNTNLTERIVILMKKRLFGLFMSMVMSISLLGVSPAISAAAATSGGFKYIVLSNGTVEISKYTGTSTKITIPSKIAGKRLQALANMLSMIVPKSLI